MKFTQIPADTFKQLQLNAGIIVDTFTPEDGTFENIIFATSGGCTFKADAEFTDFGDDIDNCPENTKELKRIDSYTTSLSGTAITVNEETATRLIGAADAASGKVTPRTDLKDDDFKDLWWVGDYSDQNGKKNGGFIAVHIMNALSTGGFQIKSDNKKKGNYSFEFTGHYSVKEPDVIPFELYIKEGTVEAEG